MYKKYITCKCVDSNIIKSYTRCNDVKLIEDSGEAAIIGSG